CKPPHDPVPCAGRRGYVAVDVENSGAFEHRSFSFLRALANAGDAANSLSVMTPLRAVKLLCSWPTHKRSVRSRGNVQSTNCNFAEEEWDGQNRTRPRQLARAAAPLATERVVQARQC